MLEKRATAIASPNIAFIKYWGNRDPALRLPANAFVFHRAASLLIQYSA